MAINLARSAPLTGGGTVDGDLHIEGNITVDGSTTLDLDQVSDGDVSIIAAASPTIALQDTTNDCILKLYAQDSNAHLGTYSDHDLFFDTNSTARVVIDSNGKVGIGTDSPGELLEIVKSAASPILELSCWSTTDGHEGSVVFQKSASATIHTLAATAALECLGAIQAKGVDTGGTARSAAQILFEGDAAPDGDAVPGRISFSTSDASNLAIRMSITDDGYVGIGTATPDTMLEVVGSFAANGPSSTFITMGDGDTSPSVSGGNIFKTHTNGVTIDQFDGGICGQIITIISGGATVYDVTSSELNGGTTNITTAAGDVTMWVCESATDWHLLSWMDLSIDLSSGGF